MKFRTPQEIFDTVARHLVKQRSQARSSSSSLCRLRAADGCRCAIGALIPPSKYRSWMEAHVVPGAARYTHLLNVIRVLPEDGGLLTALRSLHDTEDVANWPNGLVDIAMNHGLDLTVLAREFDRLEYAA